MSKNLNIVNVENGIIWKNYYKYIFRTHDLAPLGMSEQTWPSMN